MDQVGVNGISSNHGMRVASCKALVSALVSHAMLIPYTGWEHGFDHPVQCSHGRESAFLCPGVSPCWQGFYDLQARSQCLFFRKTLAQYRLKRQYGMGIRSGMVGWSHHHPTWASVLPTAPRTLNERKLKGVKFLSYSESLDDTRKSLVSEPG